MQISPLFLGGYPYFTNSGVSDLHFLPNELHGIHRRTTWLNDEDVRSPNVFFNLKIDLAVAESRDRGLSQGTAKVLTDFIRQICVCSTRKYFQRITHGETSPAS